MANDNLKDNLALSMTIAAFVGISWFVGTETIVALFITFKHRTGLYFWSILIAACGVILQPLAILLADYDIWTDPKGSISAIYLTWLIMVVPQSWVLYSRLHLVLHERGLLKTIRNTLIINSVIFSIPTIVLGTISQTVAPSLLTVNDAWDKVQFIAFFIQETSLGALYIYNTGRYLRNVSALKMSRANKPSDAFQKERHVILRYLVYINIGIIILDSAVLAIESAGFFDLQGALKPAVYAVKLKVELIILNLLVKSVELGNSKGQLDRRNDAYRQARYSRQITDPGYHHTVPDWDHSTPALNLAKSRSQNTLDIASDVELMETHMRTSLTSQRSHTSQVHAILPLETYGESSRQVSL
ncbi:integral membrane protein [Xylariaceae sp. FL0255]|nr:integral membrane protein [Xylariaceae sp. FL0255]